MKALLFLLSLLFTLTVSAQRYTSALGLRTGSPGVTYLNAKYRIDQQAYEIGIGGNTGSVWLHGNAYYQNELNDKMRAILIDWLISVHHKMGF